VDNHEKIRELSLTHKNVGKVLEELEDIIDLPTRWAGGAAAGDASAAQAAQGGWRRSGGVQGD
jgi:hypothetical protein